MGVGCVFCRGPRNMYQSVLQESLLMGRQKGEPSSNPRTAQDCLQLGSSSHWSSWAPLCPSSCCILPLGTRVCGAKGMAHPKPVTRTS